MERCISKKILETLNDGESYIVVGHSIGSRAVVEACTLYKDLARRTVGIVAISSPFDAMAKYSAIPVWWRLLSTIANGRNFTEYFWLYILSQRSRSASQSDKHIEPQITNIFL